METASLSVRPVLQHSLHNVIFITDERKSIQGSMSNKTLTQGVGAKKSHIYFSHEFPPKKVHIICMKFPLKKIQ